MAGDGEQRWLASGDPIATTTPNTALPELDADTALAWIAAGEVYVNARFGNCTLLSHACRSTAASAVELTRALIAAGADMCDNTKTHGMAPLMQWAFYAGPLATGKVLLQPRTCKTCDQPVGPELSHASHVLHAAFSAANQCNAAQLAALLASVQDALRDGGADIAAIHKDDECAGQLRAVVPGDDGR